MKHLNFLLPLKKKRSFRHMCPSVSGINRFVVCFWAISGFGGVLVTAQQPNGLQFAIYELEPKTGITNSQVSALAASQSLLVVRGTIRARGTEPPSDSIVLFKDSATTRLIFDPQTGSLELLPALHEETDLAPGVGESQKLAEEWL